MKDLLELFFQFQKSEADLDYIEKRLKLDFINAHHTGDGAPAEVSPLPWSAILKHICTIDIIENQMMHNNPVKHHTCNKYIFSIASYLIRSNWAVHKEEAKSNI